MSYLLNLQCGFDNLKDYEYLKYVKYRVFFDWLLHYILSFGLGGAVTAGKEDHPHLGKPYLNQLDRVGHVDNRPSTDKLQHLSEEKKK